MHPPKQALWKQARKLQSYASQKLSPTHKCRATSVAKNLKNTQRVVWKSIWLSTVESETIAISVLLHALTHTIWGDFWKHSREKSNICIQCEYAYLLACHLRRHLKTYGGKSQTNATNGTLHHFGQRVWGHIWKYTVDQSQTNATSAIVYPIRQGAWGDT